MEHVIVLEEPKIEHECDSYEEVTTLSNGDVVFECSHGKAMYYDKSERRYY